MKTNRDTWVDVCRGLAMVSIVLGHVYIETVSPYTSWINMPLFFFLSGWCFKPQVFSTLLVRRAKSLLIPYLSFSLILVVLLGLAEDALQEFPVWFNGYPLVFDAALSQLAMALIGLGSHPVVAVFWFATCLFITQLLYQGLHDRLQGQPRVFHGVIVLCYLVAYLDEYYLGMRAVPYAVNVVLMAIVYFHLGVCAKRLNWSHSWVWTVVSLIVLGLGGYMQAELGVHMRMVMRYTDYGLPVMHLLLAVSGIYVVVMMAKAIARVAPLAFCVGHVGRATLTIMYCHWPLAVVGSAWGWWSYANPWMPVGLIAISCVLHELLTRTSVTRRWFLGDFSSRKAVSSNVVTMEPPLPVGASPTAWKLV